jgi:hypothetical protein
MFGVGQEKIRLEEYIGPSAIRQTSRLVRDRTVAGGCRCGSAPAQDLQCKVVFRLAPTWLEVNTTPEPTNCMTGKGFERSMMCV